MSELKNEREREREREKVGERERKANIYGQHWMPGPLMLPKVDTSNWQNQLGGAFKHMPMIVKLRY